MATETMSKRTKFMPDGQNAKEDGHSGGEAAGAREQKTMCVLVTGHLNKSDHLWVFPMGPAAEGRSDTFTSSASTSGFWATLLSVLVDCLALDEIKVFLDAYATLKQCFLSRTIEKKAEGWGNSDGLDWEARSELPEAVKEAELMCQAVHLLRREGTRQQIYNFLAPEADIIAGRILEVANDLCIRDVSERVYKAVDGDTTNHTYPRDIVIVAHVQL